MRCIEIYKKYSLPLMHASLDVVLIYVLLDISPFYDTASIVTIDRFAENAKFIYTPL